MTHVEARFSGGPWHGQRQAEPIRGLVTTDGVRGVYPESPANHSGRYRVVRLDLDPRDPTRLRWIEYRWKSDAR